MTTVPIKIPIFCPVYNYKISKFSNISSACQHAVRRSCASGTAPFFHIAKVILCDKLNLPYSGKFSEGLIFGNFQNLVHFLKINFRNLLSTIAT